MKKLVLTAALSLAALMLGASSGQARMDQGQRAELCPVASEPMCASSYLPECTSRGWRCVGQPTSRPIPSGEGPYRDRNACMADNEPACMYPRNAFCVSGRWACR